MAEEAPTEGRYAIILTSLRAGAQLSVAAAEMARMFLLDARVSEQIVRKAPIIIFKGLTDAEVEAGRGHLYALSRFGMDFRVTRTPPVNVPKVNWPSRPDIASIFASPPPAPPATAAPADQEVTVQLLCPCCGSTLRLRVEALSVAPGSAAIRAERAESAPPPSAEAPPATPGAAPGPEAPAPGPEPTFEPSPAPAVEPAPDFSAPPPAPAAATATPETGVALLVPETENDHPWCDGPYEAVPVDGIQEDREFSAIGGAPLFEKPLFGDFPETAPAVVSDVEPGLVEVEPQDVSGGIEEVGPGEERVVPVDTGGGPGGGKVKDDVTVTDAELQPWTGSARAYDRSKAPKKKKKKKRKKKRRGEPEPGMEAGAGEPAQDDSELQPWTGSARAYESDTSKEKKEPSLPKAEESPAPEIDDDEAVELGMDQALVADVDEKGGSGTLEEGLEDLPELKPIGEPETEIPVAEPAGTAAPGKPKKRIKKKKIKRKAPKEAAEAPAKEKPPKPGSGLKKKKAKGEGGEYSVFLSKIVSSDRRRKAVAILTELKGIPEGEAEKLTNKMIIPVVKGVGKEEAEEILDRFKKSKISGRITRKK